MTARKSGQRTMLASDPHGDAHADANGVNYKHQASPDCVAVKRRYSRTSGPARLAADRSSACGSWRQPTSGATITVVVGHDRLEGQGPGETQPRRSGARERASSAAPEHRVPRPSIARAAISPLGLMGGLVVAIVATGLALEAWWKSVAPVACAVGAVGVVTFFGFIGIVGGVPAVIAHRARMRDAIAATFVVVYFVLLGLLAFFRGEDAPGISETLVTTSRC